MSPIKAALALFGTSLCLAGCAQKNNGPALPTGAMMVSSGSKVITYTAAHDGRMYLRDDKDNKVVYSAEVHKDQTVKYDPAMEQVMVDGKVATEKVSDPHHDHSWFFERSSQADHTDAMMGGSRNGNVPTIRVPVGVQVDVQTQPSEQK
jgi:uncharacterized protein YbaA (DUF1428 family)